MGCEEDSARHWAVKRPRVGGGLMWGGCRRLPVERSWAAVAARKDSRPTNAAAAAASVSKETGSKGMRRKGGVEPWLVHRLRYPPPQSLPPLGPPHALICVTTTGQLSGSLSWLRRGRCCGRPRVGEKTEVRARGLELVSSISPSRPPSSSPNACLLPIIGSWWCHRSSVFPRREVRRLARCPRSSH